MLLKNNSRYTNYPSKNRGSSVDTFYKVNHSSRENAQRNSNLIGNHASKISNVFYRGQAETYGLGIEVIKIDGVLDRKPSTVLIPKPTPPKTKRETMNEIMNQIGRRCNPNTKPKLPTLPKPIEYIPKPIKSPIIVRKETKKAPIKPKVQRKIRKIKTDVVQHSEMTHDDSCDSLKIKLNIKQSGLYETNEDNYSHLNNSELNDRYSKTKPPHDQKENSWTKSLGNEFELSPFRASKLESLRKFQNKSPLNSSMISNHIGSYCKKNSFIGDEKYVEVTGNNRRNCPDSFTRPDLDDDSEGENSSPKDFSIDAYIGKRKF